MADLEIRGRVLFEEYLDKLEWWQTGVIYQVYPRSFQDSRGDGVGDLNGIRKRLSYFQELGVEIVWLSPFYKSPMKDFGYDISDFCSVEPVFGKMEDFDGLLQDAHARGLKIVLDYVPNHTSDQHEWFQKSRREGPNGEYANFYVWHDGKMVGRKRQPPNNWLSVFSGSAWSWDSIRKQYYLHQFVKEQPDLNWRNPKVQKAMLDVFKFWLDRGVDGFRIDAIGHMFESKDMQDEPKSENSDVPDDDFHSLDHLYTHSQQETYDVTVKWRTFFDKYEREHKRDRIFMVSEMYDTTVRRATKFYQYGPDFPFNFNLCFMTSESDGLDIYRFVSSWLELTPPGKWPNWVLGNHDRPRVSKFKGVDFCDAANGLLLLLPGTPTSYYGEELGMENIDVRYEDTQDPYGRNQTRERYQLYSRDPSRSPMQWSGEENAGFSSAKTTWLPVHPNFNTVNVEVERRDDNSHLSIYKRLLELRKLPQFQRGAMICCLVNTNIFSFVRYCQGEPPYLVAINTSSKDFRGDFTMDIGGNMYRKGEVVVRSGEAKRADFEEVDKLQVKAKNLVVLKLEDPFPAPPTD